MRVVMAVLGLLLLAGCAQTMYRWGGYDETLYNHYKNPQDRQEFVEHLSLVISDAESRGARVPPGCYAEFGWALYEEGRGEQAVVYFAKESKFWPESRVLMEKLVRNATLRRGPASTTRAASTTGPAGALEGVAK